MATKRISTKLLGDAGENYALSQFSFAGNYAAKMPVNWEGYDLAVETGAGLVRVSVKTRSESIGHAIRRFDDCYGHDGTRHDLRRTDLGNNGIDVLGSGHWWRSAPAAFPTFSFDWQPPRKGDDSRRPVADFQLGR